MRLPSSFAAVGLVLLSTAGSARASGGTATDHASITTAPTLTVREARQALVRALPALAQVELADAGVRELANGRTVFRFPLRYRGLPIVGRRAVLIANGDGGAEALSGAPGSLPNSVAR